VMPPRQRQNTGHWSLWRDLRGIGCVTAPHGRNRPDSSVHPRSQQIAVTVLGHPAGSGEMAVVDALGALPISVRIKPKKDVDDLRPIRSLLGCVK